MKREEEKTPGKDKIYRSGAQSFNSSTGVRGTKQTLWQKLLPLEPWAVVFFYRPSRGQAPREQENTRTLHYW
jgi:hypothetical protein